MKQVRHSVFETNSSSVHSLAMCSAQQMQDWKDGKLFYREHGQKKWEVATPRLLDMDPKDRMYDEDIYTYDEFWQKVDDSWEYEGFEESYTTPSGEKIYAFGYYGENR